jgi:hypothetical protein
MRTELALVAGCLIATVALADPSELARTLPTSGIELGFPAEVTLVGLTAGVRPEVLFRLGEPGARSRLRVAAGVFVGPDQLFVPVSVGYRVVFRQNALVQPMLGFGAEVQFRFVSDVAPVPALGAYLEGGVAVQLIDHWSLGLAVTTDLMIWFTPGFGFGPRATLGYRF